MEWPLRHGCTVRAGFAFIQPLSLLRRQGRVAAPSVCFAVARILLAAAPTAPPCFRHWRRSSPLPLVGEPLAKPFTLRGLPKPPLGRSNSSKRNPTPAHSTINKQKRRRRSKSRRRRFAYAVSSGQQIRPWPRCCALPSCRRRRSGTRCSGPERSAGQPG